jgi:sporulation protein YlmC with PRC-barrel domain
MELIRDILDKQVVDREQTKIGKVDGIVLELRDGQAPRVAAIEIGAVALARRLGRRTGRLASALGWAMGGEEHREPCRIEWHKVRDIGVDLQMDVLGRQTKIFDWQNWLRDHVIGRIPGA